MIARMTGNRTGPGIAWAMSSFRLVVLIVIVLYGWAENLQASVRQVSNLCDAAASVASRETGVPLEVMQAITRAETGRSLMDIDGIQPWPWAINQGGKGGWFDTEKEARAVAELAVAQGFRNIDIGCFQLNHRWHAKGFTSLKAMFDPLENARYAARYLQEKYQETGDWSLAAGAYHSGTPEFSERYRSRFDEILSSLYLVEPGDENEAKPSLRHPREPSVNQFPLLVVGNAGARGSLVPMVQGRRPLFGAP